jgi:hypothetical protein
MASISGTLYKSDSTPATGGNQIQFKNRSTNDVTTADVNSSGQYATSLAVGTYDIGVNGDYTDNNPSSVVMTTLPKVLNITSPHAV